MQMMQSCVPELLVGEDMQAAVITPSEPSTELAGDFFSLLDDLPTPHSSGKLLPVVQ